MGHNYGSKTTFWSVIIKIVFILGVYITGVFTSDWWAKKYYDARVKAAEYIYPSDSIASDSGVFKPFSAPSPNKELSTLYVPFTEKNGVKYIKIKVGNMVFDAIYDTGCGFPISFTPKAYYKMVGAGIVEDEKFTHQSVGVIADGTHIPEYHFVIPKFSIGDLTFTNYSVSVSMSGDEILVGNPLWSDYKSYTIDNENKRLVFIR